jgi:hypothetical protein
MDDAVQALNLDIVREIIRSHTDDLAAFASWALAKCETK